MTTSRFQVQLAITGRLADAVVSTIKVPGAQQVNFVREQEIPLPRLWFDRADNRWKPELWGASLLAPAVGWSLDVLREWTRRYTPRFPGRPVILDIEDVHPFVETMQADAPQNYDALSSAARSRYTTAGYELRHTHGLINAALREAWTALLDGLIARGFDVSVYGHTPLSPNAVTNDLRFRREWFDSRVRRTHPVIYEWQADRPHPNAHCIEVATPRTDAARTLCPLKPCLPFVTPVLDQGDRLTMIDETRFRGMVHGAMVGRAAGVVLWYHADDPSRLTPWLGVVDKYINPVLQEACAA